MKLSVLQKGIILFAVPLLCNFILFLCLNAMVANLEEQTEREIKAKRFLALCDRMSKASYELGYRASDLIDKHNFKNLDPIRNCVADIENSRDDLKKAVQDDPVENAAFQRLNATVDEALEQIKAIDQALSHPSIASFMAAKERVENYRDHREELGPKLLEEFKELTAPAEKIAVESPAIENEIRVRQRTVVQAGMIADVILMLAFLLLFSRSITSRLRTVMENTLRLAQNKPLCPLIGGSDEIAQLDRVFHEMKDSLDEANRAKQEFLQMITHDLRSPLTSISGNLIMLEQGVFGEISEQASERVQNMKKSTDRLIRLINQMLELERLHAGKMPLTVEDHSLDDLVENSIRSIEAYAGSRNVGISYINRDDIMLRVDGDRIVEALINLISNAVKFSPAGEAVVVSVSNEGGRIKIEVADKGPGIPEDKRDAVFERFQQLDGNLAAKKEGSGLGLAICKMIAEAHDGGVSVKGRDGGGSIFVFDIPLSRELTPAIIEPQNA